MTAPFPAPVSPVQRQREEAMTSFEGNYEPCANDLEADGYAEGDPPRHAKYRPSGPQKVYLPTEPVLHNGGVDEEDPAWVAHVRRIIEQEAAFEAAQRSDQRRLAAGVEPDGRTPRDELPPLQRAVSDALDDYLSRKLGVVSSSSDWDLFLSLLREEGYDVTVVEAPAGRPESRRQT